MATTLNELINNFKNLAAAIEKESKTLTDKAALDLHTAMDKRIFIDGDTRASDYNSEYAIRRSMAGLQTKVKTFRFTDGLRKSFVVKDNTVGFNNQRSIDIASIHQKREKALIFNPIKSEIDDVVKYLIKEVNEIITKNL